MSKNKIIILVGLPASGKSTWASKQMLPVVSRDAVRPYFSGSLDKTILSFEQENLVTEIQRGLAKTYLDAGLSVIVDDMNVRSKYVSGWVEFAILNGVDYEFRVFSETLSTLLDRNNSREHPVPNEVIESIYSRFTANGVPRIDFNRIGKNVVDRLSKSTKPSIQPYVADTSLPKAVIVDLDGTLAHNVSGRHWYALDDSYMSDEVDESVQFVVESFINKGYTVIFMSGRDERTRDVTEKWLREKAGFEPTHLFMRPAHDSRTDSIVKIELFDKHLRDSYNVVLSIDDRKQVVAAWRELGLRVWQVAEGDF